MKLKLVRFEPKSRADMVLSRCRDSTVHCYDNPARSLKLALFLEAHAEEGPERVERVRAAFAYRNHQPETVRFTRSIVAEEGVMVAPHDAEEILEILAAKEDQTFAAGLARRAVRVTRCEDDANVSGIVVFVDEDGRPRGEKVRRVVVLPKAGDPLECSCCLARSRT